MEILLADMPCLFAVGGYEDIFSKFTLFIRSRIIKTLDRSRGFAIYICSGADTPSKRKAFAIVSLAAVTSARRASV